MTMRATNMTMRHFRGIDRRGLPPGPAFAPLQTILYMRDPYGYTRRMRKRYGDVFTMPSMNGLLLLTTTPEGAQEILTGRAEDFDKGFGASALEPILGRGSLLLLSGSRHSTERKMLSPTFHGTRLRALEPAIREATLRRIETWQDGQRTRLLEEMQTISLDVIICTALGIDDPRRLEMYRSAIRRAVNEVPPALFFFRFMQRELGGFGPWAAYLRHREKLHRMISEEIELARRQPADLRSDILASLAHVEREDGQRLSDAQIREHLLTLLVAGHETTSSALAWTLYELTRHPDVLDWLLSEIETIGSEASVEPLASLPALESTAREGLRLHPVLAEFFRPLRESARFLGHTVPAGVVLAASILEIHRNEELYPQPEAFRPARFLERRFAPHEFAAFGGGHRHCLGSAFALAEMAIVLGTILPRFRFELDSDKPLGIERRTVTLAPEGGVAVTIRKR